MSDNENNIDFEGDHEFKELIQKKENRFEFLCDENADNTHLLCCIRSDNGEIIENEFSSCLIPYKNGQYEYSIFKLKYIDVLNIEKELVKAGNIFLGTKNPTSFRSFLKCEDELKDKIINFIRAEIVNSSKINITMAAITFALKKKNYLFYDKQTIYHNALKAEFGNVGQRNKFSERSGECNNQHQDIIQYYLNNLP